jgi:predicted nucleic acid-binding protein
MKSDDAMPEAYLLDTNIICALADANRVTHESATRRLRQAIGKVLLPSLALGEIEFGMSIAPNIHPDKRQVLREFMAQFKVLPFDKHCVKPYSLIRAEIWRKHGTPKIQKQHSYKESRPEDLLDKATGSQLGVDEPDLLIASIALAQNLVLVTNDNNSGMKRVKEASDEVFKKHEFPYRLRVEDWLSPIG